MGIKTDFSLNPVHFGTATTYSPQVLGEPNGVENLLRKPPRKSIIDYKNIKHYAYFNIACFPQKSSTLPSRIDYPAAAWQSTMRQATHGGGEWSPNIYLVLCSSGRRFGQLLRLPPSQLQPEASLSRGPRALLLAVVWLQENDRCSRELRVLISNQRAMLCLPRAYYVVTDKPKSWAGNQFLGAEPSSPTQELLVLGTLLDLPALHLKWG